ncbi:hypothetical protein OSB04_026680 [Centaurea solstitialis]|uniref:Nucleotidyl transferase domain-containing protein n=1 Tax=Centaurea solstitialis TaxID=347529 RepID=A0AA38SDP7_9ASTR|nr:hypothetical protein OSB04_026680 [Centaurea solstitialis]
MEAWRLLKVKTITADFVDRDERKITPLYIHLSWFSTLNRKRSIPLYVCNWFAFSFLVSDSFVLQQKLPNMKALILVGGFGTRLRPLTLSVPKPLVDFANKPMILHQIEALKAIGVTEVVLAINYQPEVMLNFLKDFEAKLGITISCSQETEPLGNCRTPGPSQRQTNRWFWRAIFCFDGIFEIGGRAFEIRVVVMEESTGQVERFVEKPKVFVGNKINAGIYLLSPSVLDRIELKPTSIEKETFPKIASEKLLYAMVLPGFWMDIGQPKDYITGLRLYLDSLRKNAPSKLARDHTLWTVSVHRDAGVRIKKHACISSSIIGWHSTVGQWARVENMTILGEDVHVCDEVYSNGGVVLPHKEIKASILKPEIVM